MNATATSNQPSHTIVLLKVLEAICDLDPGSTRAPDREAICETVEVARALVRRAKVNTDQTGAWNTSEAPKDRPIVAFGKIMVSDEFSTAAIPFCSAIEWKELGGHADWYMYHDSDQPMALRRALDEEVIIHYWQDLPTNKTKSEVAA